MEKFDFLVIGAGISGAAAAYYLADHGTVAVVEKEEQAGYHTTGRSAAMFSDQHGPDLICKLARASYAFLDTPPEGFSPEALLTDHGVLFTGTKDELGVAAKLCEPHFEGQSNVEQISSDAAKALMPFVKDEFIQSPAHYEDAKEIDVAALHHGFLTGAKKKGGHIYTDQDVLNIEKADSVWIVKTKDHSFIASKVINAAGAWADELTEMAGFAPLGLTPKRRTVVVVDLPEEYRGQHYPMTIFHDQSLYFKVEHDQVLISPMDKTPSVPTDAVPDEYDKALAAHLFEERTGIQVKKINNEWAGLRCFYEHDEPILDDLEDSGFIVLAGQGGYGIKISESMGRIAASVALGRELPEDVRALGISLDDLSVARLAHEGHKEKTAKIA